MKSSAHYKKGISKIEGKLYLSANKLEFKTLMISLRTEKFDINLEDISSVSLAWTKFLVYFLYCLIQFLLRQKMIRVISSLLKKVRNG